MSRFFIWDCPFGSQTWLENPEEKSFEDARILHYWRVHVITLLCQVCGFAPWRKSRLGEMTKLGKQPHLHPQGFWRLCPLQSHADHLKWLVVLTFVGNHYYPHYEWLFIDISNSWYRKSPWTNHYQSLWIIVSHWLKNINRNTLSWGESAISQVQDLDQDGRCQDHWGHDRWEECGDTGHFMK